MPASEHAYWRPSRSGALARLACIAAWLWAAVGEPATARAQGIRPKSLLVYYGYPSSINSAWAVPAAAREFGRYEYVLWGQGLDDPTHPDHANAQAIVLNAAAAQTRFFGYVDVGVTTQNHPMSEIQTEVTRWHAMGMYGVHFDNFGYDFGTTRVRQNAAVDFAHSLGLAVVVNAFRPEDAFGRVVDPIHNPTGAATRLGASDFYFYESHGVILGQFENALSWRARSEAVAAFRLNLGFRVFSSTSSAMDNPAIYDESAFFFAWHAALLYGHEATAWGEYGYSASGASNGQAPFRARPTLDPGNSFSGPVQHSGSLHSRTTDGGRLELDTGVHQYAFFPASVDVPGEVHLAANRLSAYPNPSPGATRFGFTLDRSRDVRLAVYDAVGRRIAALTPRNYATGRGEAVWSGLDDAGQPVASGSYFVVLESEGSRSVARFLVVR